MFYLVNEKGEHKVEKKFNSPLFFYIWRLNLRHAVKRPYSHFSH
jgi:hypothetical protein